MAKLTSLLLKCDGSCRLMTFPRMVEHVTHTVDFFKRKVNANARLCAFHRCRCINKSRRWATRLPPFKSMFVAPKLCSVYKVPARDTVNIEEGDPAAVHDLFLPNDRCLELSDPHNRLYIHYIT